MEPAEYCREVEAYLCRKNDGHLIRIVGPAFEQVCGWAAQGVPLKVAFRGIDQYCERYYAKGTRRRPVRIEFCEADILDQFDSWRRAVGVSRSAEWADAEEPAPRRPALAAHIERVIARLTVLRAGRSRDGLAAAIDAAVRELDHLGADARTARGERREAIIARLEALDDDIVGAAETEVQSDPSRLASLTREAEAELAPFALRMPEAEFARAKHVAYRRLLRDACGLPVLSYE